MHPIPSLVLWAATPYTGALATAWDCVPWAGPRTLAVSRLGTTHCQVMDQTLPQRLQKSVAGSFHKTALLQKRVREIVRGAAPLIETRETNPIKIAFLEMERGLIELIPEEDQPLL